VGKCRERCWRYDWVIDLDVQKFFDTVPWERIIAAVEANTALPWVILYVKRWLAAPVRMPDGTLAARDRGAPQGSAVSPVLANLFMHYAFDLWLAREFPGCPFERYADDAVVHCRTKAQAEAVLDALRNRMEQVGVRLHPDKTRIVYCKDGRRSGSHEHTEFTFLGFTFRARGMRTRHGDVFTGFGPAASKDAIKKMNEQVKSWRLHRLTGHAIGEIARAINPVIRGWMQYYGRFYKSELYPLLNAFTGAELWSASPGGDGYSSPSVATGVVYIGSPNGSVYALNAATGAELWSYSTNGAAVYSSPAVADGVVYVGTDDGTISMNDGQVYALDSSTGAEMWCGARIYECRCELPVSEMAHGAQAAI
jgi:group II intron reverse transcriptase/maturase